jgi:hypothetical protein
MVMVVVVAVSMVMVVVVAVSMVMIVVVAVSMVMIVVVTSMIMSNTLASGSSGSSAISLQDYHIWFYRCDCLLDLRHHSIRILGRKSKLLRSIGHRHIR